jgi:long-chain fatty acid transport protein
VGVAPIIGADVKWNKLNLGLKYEFKTNANVKNKTTTNNSPAGPLPDYADGVKTPYDIPALLTAALGYDILPTLRATAEWHYFFDKQADMANNKQEKLSRGTYEYLFGVEWDVHKYVSISGGLQITDFGVTDDFQSDMSFFLNSYSLGFGAGIHVSPKIKINVAYMWTNYSDYTKDSQNYNGLPLSGKDVYSRTNQVFGLGVDLKL